MGSTGHAGRPHSVHRSQSEVGGDKIAYGRSVLIWGRGAPQKEVNCATSFLGLERREVKRFSSQGIAEAKPSPLLLRVMAHGQAMELVGVLSYGWKLGLCSHPKVCL